MIRQPIRSVVMNGGQGDVVMAAAGLHAMLLLAPTAFASDLTCYVRSYIAPVIAALLPECKVLSIEQVGAAQRPRYYTAAHTSGSTLWRNAFGADYYINYAATRERISFGAQPLGQAQRTLHFLTDLVVEKRFSWRRSAAQYYGMKKWSPLAERAGFAEIDLLRALHQSFAVLRQRLSALPVPPPGQPAPVAIFPVGRSFQTFPPEFVQRLLAGFAEHSATCYFAADEARRSAYEAAGLDCAVANEPEAMLAVMQQARVVITCDSLPSHLAQLVARHHLALMSHDLPQHTLHPAAASVTVFRPMPCAPCTYLSSLTNRQCMAGRPACGVFELDDYLAAARRGLRLGLLDGETHA